MIHVIASASVRPRCPHPWPPQIAVLATGISRSAVSSPALARPLDLGPVPRAKRCGGAATRVEVNDRVDDHASLPSTSKCGSAATSHHWPQVRFVEAVIVDVDFDVLRR